MTGSIKPFDG